MSWTVAALYRFARVDDTAAMAAHLKDLCAANDACGTLITAREGINGTIAAPDAVKMECILAFIRAQFPGVDIKMSAAAEKPFKRLKIKIKPEIVTMRVPGVDPNDRVGIYVDPAEWNALLDDPEVVVIDTRNGFEYAYGTFDRAVDPGTVSFHEFPGYVERTLDPARHKKVAMFCTGGIRCEKASSYMVARGFEQVYHLKGGILKYLEDMPEDQSRWHGRCFVFDERESLGHGLREDA